MSRLRLVLTDEPYNVKIAGHVTGGVRRYEAASGEAAVLVETGETFEDLQQQRARERTGGTLMETEN